jgi:hypothetical protein
MKVSMPNATDELPKPASASSESKRQAKSSSLVTVAAGVVTFAVISFLVYFSFFSKSTLSIPIVSGRSGGDSLALAELEALATKSEALEALNNAADQERVRTLQDSAAKALEATRRKQDEERSLEAKLKEEQELKEKQFREMKELVDRLTAAKTSSDVDAALRVAALEKEKVVKEEEFAEVLKRIEDEKQELMSQLKATSVVLTESLDKIKSVDENALSQEAINEVKHSTSVLDDIPAVSPNPTATMTVAPKTRTTSGLRRALLILLAVFGALLLSALVIAAGFSINAYLNPDRNYTEPILYSIHNFFVEMLHWFGILKYNVYIPSFLNE